MYCARGGFRGGGAKGAVAPLPFTEQ